MEEKQENDAKILEEAEVINHKHNPHLLRCAKFITHRITSKLRVKNKKTNCAENLIL